MSDEEEEVYEEEIEEEEEDDEPDDESIYEDEPSVGDIDIEVPEEEDEVEHFYKTKFNEDLRNEYLQKFHPEEIHKTFDEIYKLSLVIRDEQGKIIDMLHKSYPILTKYE